MSCNIISLDKGVEEGIGREGSRSQLDRCTDLRADPAARLLSGGWLVLVLGFVILVTCTKVVLPLGKKAQL